MQQVAAREAWLNSSTNLPVETWLHGNGGQQISLEINSDGKSNSDFLQKTADKSLIVIDSRSNQWESLSHDLPEESDLLVLNEDYSGTQQLEDLLSQQISNGSYSKISVIGSANGQTVSFGSQNFEQEEAIVEE